MASDDFRLPRDHPMMVELRLAREEREATLRHLADRLTTYADVKTQLIGGVGLALFTRDHPAGGFRLGLDDEQWPDPTTDELLGVLGYVPDVRKYLDRNERSLIEGARRRGATWQQITEALGLKSARQRFARLGGKPAELDKQLSS